MLAKTYSYGLIGLEAYPLTIEVDVARGMPFTIIVGLPDNAIKESKERVRTAIKNSGYSYPDGRVTINLSPADLKKEGPSFDLAIALGILAASGQITTNHLNHFAILGELSLDGNLQPIQGALSVSLALRSSPFQGVILPTQNAQEASLVNQSTIYPMKNLKEVIRFLSEPADVSPYISKTHPIDLIPDQERIDFADVKFQAHVKRGLEVAAAGGHNVLLIGPPGSGKSMLAKRLPTILPNMNNDEALETTKIYSVMGLLKSEHGIVTDRPFRSPHHTTSDVALVGGGSSPRPGEVTLSHNGVLFLDELPEFARSTLEALRQPLEDHNVTVSRASRSLSFPAKFILVCAMNPCPCGFLTDSRKKCACHPTQIQKYLSKISGPLLDRIDIHLDVPALPSSELMNAQTEERSQTIKERTTMARSIQLDRFKGSKIFANGFMSHSQIKKFCPLDTESRTILKSAIQELGLSARAYDKILKVARTIADLDGKQSIEIQHVAEAIQYRNLDRNCLSWQTS